MLSNKFIRFESEATLKAIQQLTKRDGIPGIGRIILTSGCKGGVGKSTVAVNTALALSDAGMKVGIFDADIYSPSIPHFCNLIENQLSLTSDKKFIPIPAYGIETISVGNGVEKDQALLWKGPFVPQLINELLKKAAWPVLDYLIIDTPSGTGDVLISINESVPIDGAIIVTTPQAVAINDAIRNLDAFKKLRIPVIGMVKNFDGYRCKTCNKPVELFKTHDPIDISKKYSIDLFGSIPMSQTISTSIETGFPAFLCEDDPSINVIFKQIAQKIIAKVPKKKEEEINNNLNKEEKNEIKKEN